LGVEATVDWSRHVIIFYICVFAFAIKGQVRRTRRRDEKKPPLRLIDRQLREMRETYRRPPFYLSSTRGLLYDTKMSGHTKFPLQNDPFLTKFEFGVLTFVFIFLSFFVVRYLLFEQ